VVAMELVVVLELAAILELAVLVADALRGLPQAHMLVCTQQA